jgi:hypothetical protein
VILFGPQETLRAFPESLERTLSLARVQAFVAQHLFPAAQP